MSVIRLSDVTKKYDQQYVLRGVSLRLSDGDRVGLIGNNGSGKTTILRLILAQEEPTEGSVDRNLGLKVGYFSQTSELNGLDSVQQVLENVFADVRAFEDELSRIAVELESQFDTDEMTTLLDRQAHLFEEMQRRDGWEYPRMIDTVLTKLGFNAAHRLKPIDELSGGWRNRASLAKLLLQQPEVLLLDEPTNFLDVQGVSWLEDWLKAFRGALLLVSHDRQFLDRVANRIVEIENHRLQEYDGNYTHYVQTKPFRIKNLERQFEYEEELLVIEGEAAADRDELTRNPSDSVRRKLADIKKRRPPRPVDLIVTNIYQHLTIPERLCRTEALEASYGEQTLFENVAFELRKGERLGIVGPNGIGKSTLLNVLTGHLKANRGQVVWERGVSFVDFNEVHRDLDLADTVSHAVNTFGLGLKADRKHVNRFLSLLQFSENELSRRIGTLSGGQRARVALAKCLVSEAAVLILDEPTNHLDLNSTQVMEQALVHFPGGVIVVSHDRFFLDKVATRLLVFSHDESPYEFNGNWTMWENRRAAEPVP